jgi:hypothetical protein
LGLGVGTVDILQEMSGEQKKKISTPARGSERRKKLGWAQEMDTAAGFFLVSQLLNGASRR